jgi:hypothetical protein
MLPNDSIYLKQCIIVPSYLIINNHTLFFRHKKGKAIPLQAWTGPEGSRKLKLPDFMTIGT